MVKIAYGLINNNNTQKREENVQIVRESKKCDHIKQSTKWK